MLRHCLVGKLSLALFIGFLCGCAGPWRGQELPPRAWRDATVVVMDRALKTWVPLDVGWGGELKVGSETSSCRDDGRLHVRVEFHNTTAEPLNLQIQTAFKDSQGMITEDQTNWEHVIIPKRSLELYTATSLSARAKGYVVRVRKAE